MNYPEAQRSELLSDRLMQKVVPAQLAALDNWRVLRHLGSGSTAHVWLLEHKWANRTVACKTPSTPADAKILSQETELALSLQHENLVRALTSRQIQDWQLSVDEGAATFWEHLPAGSLESLVAARGPLGVEQSVTVVLPMLQVAEYLHAHQIVHGDFSPANILFDLNGRPVLIDLGAVRATAHTFHRTGTPGFAAPEIAAPGGHEGLGLAADVYSLAAIGWFCLTGTVPGPPDARTPLVMLQPEIDPEIAELLEACLMEEPVLRPPLSQLLSGVSRWAEPAPVDLYASAGEDYELLLPTRKPHDHPRAGRRRHRRSMNDDQHEYFSLNEPAEAHDVAMGLRKRRLAIAASIAALLTGCVFTMLQGVPEREHAPVADEMLSDSSDFQAVIDELAKARSDAWAAADFSAVATYAVEGSEAFDNDVRVLSALHKTGMDLDGIRMRAVVEAVDDSQQSAAVEVEWRTDSYVQRGASQQVVETVEARTEQLVLHLQQTSDGWLLHSVESPAD